MTNAQFFVLLWVLGVILFNLVLISLYLKKLVQGISVLTLYAKVADLQAQAEGKP